ncbi:LCP family protein [Actinomyces sp. zg296]|uniref:LCP family protein n=1 Tax=Actinomyces sp. zg296 TaxID=2609289 RepID=UPI00135A2745|nr:LCP family protein [Actinomyces sp. zg296]
MNETPDLVPAADDNARNPDVPSDTDDSSAEVPLPGDPMSPADPGPADDATRAVLPARHRGPRGRRWRVGLVSVLVLLLVLVTGVGAFGWWLRHRVDSAIERIPDPFASLTERPSAADAQGDAPVNILVMGSDSRISAGDPSQWKQGGQRTDAMMLIHINGDRRGVSVISIPRDSWVPIPGHGTGKINAAFSYGGPALAIQTVESLTGVRIDHFAVTDFESFAALTDEIGGVTLRLRNPTTLAGTEFAAGPQRLNGAQALAFTRERYSLSRGDFSRIQRQQAWMRAVVSQVLNGGLMSDPAGLYRFLSVAARTMAVDEGFSIDEMQSLALSLRGLGSSGITYVTAPVQGTGTSEDGQSIVLLDRAADAPLFEAVANDTVSQYLAEHADAVPQLPAAVE